MKKSKSILMVGPFPEPTTGVSLANEVVYETLRDAEAFSVSRINTSYHKFDENIGSFSIGKLLFYLKFNFKLFSVFKYDVFYYTPGQTFFGLMKYLLFVSVASLCRKEIILHVHGNHFGTEYQQLTGLKKALFKWVAKQTTLGIVLSESLKANLTPFIPSQDIKVLYNFAQDYIWQDVKTANASKLQIIYLSNLMREKGIMELLEALAMLEEAKIPYEAKIAGSIDAKNESAVKELLDRLQHSHYVGVVAGAEKKELLQWGNVFALPTFYAMEGQPISILEAMATGNVIVTTAHAGIPDIIEENRHGFFAEKEDAQSLFQLFKMLHEQPERRLEIAETNKQYFHAHFSLESFQKQLIAILQHAS